MPASPQSQIGHPAPPLLRHGATPSRRGYADRWLWLRLGLLLCLGLTAWAPSARAAEQVPLYTYYADPPFSPDWPTNLTGKLATVLTARSKGQYVFVPTLLPRRRLDHLLRQPDWAGMVAWANPRWFDDDTQTRYIWSRPLMRDADLVVSRRNQPFEYADQGASLIGLRLGGITGHRYIDLEPLIRDGKLVRDDANSEQASLLKLKYERVQVALVMASSMPYLEKAIPDLTQWLHIASQPRFIYSRYLFANRKQTALMAYANTVIAQLVREPEWQAILANSRVDAR